MTDDQSEEPSDAGNRGERTGPKIIQQDSSPSTSPSQEPLENIKYEYNIRETQGVRSTQPSLAMKRHIDRALTQATKLVNRRLTEPEVAALAESEEKYYEIMTAIGIPFISTAITLHIFRTWEEFRYPFKARWPPFLFPRPRGKSNTTGLHKPAPSGRVISVLLHLPRVIQYSCLWMGGTIFAVRTFMHHSQLHREPRLKGYWATYSQLMRKPMVIWRR